MSVSSVIPLAVVCVVANINAKLHAWSNGFKAVFCEFDFEISPYLIEEAVCYTHPYASMI